MHIPVSTYRLQFHREFRFEDARRLVPYLSRLGVSDLYASPLLKARIGSRHGYDVTDPSEWNPELGPPERLQALVEELQRNEMDLLLDVVPNHMAASIQNPWWRNLLESGVDSAFAGWFDMDRKANRQTSRHRVVLPILGSPLGRVLQRNELQLMLGEYGFLLRYYEHDFPVALRSCARLLTMNRDELRSRLDPRHPAWQEIDEVTRCLASLGRRRSIRVGSLAEVQAQQDEASALRRTIWRLYEDFEPVRLWLEHIVAMFGETHTRDGREQMDRLLAEQPYRLVWWRAASREINYRRFFAISELVSLNIQLPPVFSAVHGLVGAWIRAGRIRGLRVDHIDGLHDPLEYLQRLQHLSGPQRPLYVVVEKILAPQERLPSEWPVAGTTGYDFLTLTDRLLIDEEGYQRLRRIYRQFIRRELRFDDVVYGKKRQAMSSFFAGEIDGLARRLGALARLASASQDLDSAAVAAAFFELTACFPVYRTYIREGRVSAADGRVIDRAAAEASRRSPALHPAALEWVRQVLRMDAAAGIPDDQRGEWLGLIQRWQQYTGPIMAKGHEDAGLYVYVPLTSLNEVGGDPAADAVTVECFHGALADRQKAWPHAMNASSTHDTKRSEDVRARLHALSEIPAEWRACLERWSGWNRARRTLVQRRPVPDRNTEYLLYQTLLGALPMDWVRRIPAAEELAALQRRIRDYMLKAAREAKVQTRWIQPNADFESALARFVDAIFASAPRDPFFSDLLRLLRLVAPVGAINSLSQLVLKLTAPGVPDFYQGAELWDLHLV